MIRPPTPAAWPLSVLLCLSLLAPVTAARSETAPGADIDFALTDLDGRAHKLSEYRGRWVILNFWATWCPPCLDELPELVDYRAAHPDQVMLGLDVEEIEPRDLKAFAAANGINYPLLPVADTALPGLDPISGIPTTVIITPDGQLIAKHVGRVTRQMLEDFIGREEAALAKVGSTASP